MTVNVFFAATLAVASSSGTATNGLPSIAAVSGCGMQATTNCTYLPAGLRYTAEEAEAISERRKAEWSALGYEARRPYHAGHYFGSWTKGRLWEKHREYFGLTPYGTRGVEMPGFPPWMRSLSKMCVSNEEVVDERIEAWKRAGCPQLLVCGENDGLVGFCRCEKCRALDADLPGEPFLHNKTDRYLDFWNRVCAKARAIRPDVTVCVHAYSLMRHPPRRVHVAYPDNIIFSYVPSYHDTDPAGEIAEWKKMGMKHFFFRPNYLCNRTVFPIAREKYIYDIHRIFRAAGGTGDSFDNTPGVAAMGFECYTAVRLCADPDVAFEEIERGWYARYGAAAETVRAYHERLRERCDREWARLLDWLRVNDVEFLDDSHFSRCYHRLHTVDDLKGDLALLEEFDDSALEGEAKARFANLKLCAQHYILTRQALATRTDADKEALVAFRVAHRDSLGSAWTAHWNKGEFVLWNDTPAKRAYENTGIASYVERFERAMATKPARQLINELKSPLDDSRVEPMYMAVVRDRGPKKIGTNVPEDVRLTPAEMKAVFEKRRAEWAALGYVETYPKDWRKCNFYVDGAKVRAAHPEFFGLTPSGKRYVSLKGWPKWFEGLTKWCVSNEALVDAIVEKWRKAGRPYLLRFYENDGLLGFCRCEKCCALDADRPGGNFLDHKTDRYLSLFNRVTAKARAERPDVTVLTFFYSNYRFPPRREKVAFPDNQVCVLIPSLIDDVPADFEGWRKAGMKRFGTRPNYLCHYMPIPRGIEKRIYDELKMFREAGSIGAEWDASPGTAANAFDFYVAVRLAAHPDLSFEEVEDGWCERFGAAKETVRGYYRRVRDRCNRSWKELIRYFNDNHLDFLDDGHLSSYTPRLHTEAELKEDVAFLKKFDASTLEGEAKRRFDDLVFMAEHALATWKANITKSKADKAALHAMRVKNKLRLGDGTRKWYKVAEALLWDDTPRNRVYYNDFAVPRLADAYERAHAE